MYRDLTENKPPLGYWLYALAVWIGGYNELAIRLMPIPAVLLTIALLWWIGEQLAGPLRRLPGRRLFALLSTDPFLFGNGSNMEHFMNLFSIASLAFLILAWESNRRWPIAAAGACLGAAALIKQVAILPLAVYLLALLLRRPEDRANGAWQTWSRRIADITSLCLGAGHRHRPGRHYSCGSGGGSRSLRRHHAIRPRPWRPTRCLSLGRLRGLSAGSRAMPIPRAASPGLLARRIIWSGGAQEAGRSG